jgi:hypothetical protein
MHSLDAVLTAVSYGQPRRRGCIALRVRRGTRPRTAVDIMRYGLLRYGITAAIRQHVAAVESTTLLFSRLITLMAADEPIDDFVAACTEFAGR